MSFRDRIARKPLGAYRPPEPAIRHRVPIPVLQAWISAVIDQLHAYAAQGIKEDLTLAAWADGYSIEQVAERAREMGTQP